MTYDASREIKENFDNESFNRNDIIDNLSLLLNKFRNQSDFSFRINIEGFVIRKNINTNLISIGTIFYMRKGIRDGYYQIDILPSKLQVSFYDKNSLEDAKENLNENFEVFDAYIRKGIEPDEFKELDRNENMSLYEVVCECIRDFDLIAASFTHGTYHQLKLF